MFKNGYIFIYHWYGVSTEGLCLQGQIRAPNMQLAKAQLLNFGITVNKINRNFYYKMILTPQCRIQFTEQLSDLVGAGISLPRALDALQKAFSDLRVKTLFWLMRHYIELGQSFGKVLHFFPREFSLTYRQLIEIGEMSGQLEKTLLKAAELEKKKMFISNQFKKASFYPLLVLSLSSLIILFLIIGVVPKFVEIFTQAKLALPIYTQFLINISNFLINNFSILGFIFLSILFVYGYLFKTSNYIRKISFYGFLYLPYIGKIIKWFFLSHFSYGLSTLLQVGIPLTQSLGIMLSNMTHLLYKEEIKKILYLVKKGNALSQSLNESFLFPDFVVYTTKIGEESGLMASSLLKIANFYEGEINRFIDGISLFLEPVLMIILGLIVGIFMLGLYLPIFSLGNAM